jgi:hypothetical protein
MALFAASGASIDSYTDRSKGTLPAAGQRSGIPGLKVRYMQDVHDVSSFQPCN